MVGGRRRRGGWCSAENGFTDRPSVCVDVDLAWIVLGVGGSGVSGRGSLYVLLCWGGIIPYFWRSEWWRGRVRGCDSACCCGFIPMALVWEIACIGKNGMG